MSAAPEETRTLIGPELATEAPAGDRVEHLYWVGAGKVAQELGVQVQSICTEAWFFLDVDDEHELVAATGRQSEDCPRCLLFASEVPER